MVILDTCALIELCKEEVALSAKTLRLMSKASSILSISFAEIACKVKLGKLEMRLTTRELHQHFTQIENMSIVDIDTKAWLDSIELHWPQNKDPADRLIVAYAMQKKVPIVSSDIKLQQFYPKVIW